MRLRTLYLASHSDWKWVISWNWVEYLPIHSQLFARKKVVGISRGYHEVTGNLDTCHWNPSCFRIHDDLIFTKHGTRICSPLGCQLVSKAATDVTGDSKRKYIDHWSSLIHFRYLMLGCSSYLTINLSNQKVQNSLATRKQNREPWNPVKSWVNQGILKNILSEIFRYNIITWSNNIHHQDDDDMKHGQPSPSWLQNSRNQQWVVCSLKTVSLRLLKTKMTLENPHVQ